MHDLASISRRSQLAWKGLDYNLGQNSRQMLKFFNSLSISTPSFHAYFWDAYFTCKRCPSTPTTHNYQCYIGGGGGQNKGPTKLSTQNLRKISVVALRLSEIVAHCCKLLLLCMLAPSQFHQRRTQSTEIWKQELELTSNWTALAEEPGRLRISGTEMAKESIPSKVFMWLINQSIQSI